MFVRTKTNGDGIGVLIGHEDDAATIEYFDSPVTERIQQTVLINSLEEVQLELESRVYYHDTQEDAWITGRVLDYQEDDRQYLIDLKAREPNELIDESKLFVRWNRPISTPVGHLAWLLNEPPEAHARRHAFLKEALHQRAWSCGMTGLASSAIDLEEHQIRVVRRILHDVTPRYLLADEVGLGKTIEAGILLRQYILDYPLEHDVVIIVPQHLRAQWSYELSRLFSLRPYLKTTVRIITSEDLDELGDCDSTGMLIIDEAHHVTAQWSPDSPEHQAFQTIRELAENTPRLLLLSATPVLHNESSYFAMLHLIDPCAYPLSDKGLTAFKEKVDKRQEIAEILSTLRDEESNFFLSDAIDDLQEFFPEDSHLCELLTNLKRFIDDDSEPNLAGRSHAISELRSHIRQAYRLDQRLIRNRRGALMDRLLPGRGGVQIKDCQSDGTNDVLEILDDWRVETTLAIDAPGGDNPDSYAKLYRLFNEIILSDPLVLSDACELRLAQLEPQEHKAGFTTNEMKLLRDTPLFTNEAPILEKIADRVLDCDSKPRQTVVIDLIEQLLTESSHSRIIVFTSFKSTAKTLATAIAFRIGDDTVVRHSSKHTRWHNIFKHPQCRIIVCDRRAEEGLNLQHDSAVIIHYDLPLSANRIEQRIGRADRFHAGQPVVSYCLRDTAHSDQSVEQMWLFALESGYRVFDRSIASLQYLIDKESEHTWSDIYTEGLEAMQTGVERLVGEKGLVELELRKIRAQEDLDAMQDSSPEEDAFLQKLKTSDLEANHSDSKLNRWLVDELKHRLWEHNPRSIIRYQYCCTDNRGRPQTCWPYRWYRTEYETVLDNDFVHRHNPADRFTYKMCYDRQQARRSGVAVARFGHPFIDRSLQHLRADDRGNCFAFWRQIPTLGDDFPNTHFFRFDYWIEADSEHFERHCENDPSASREAIRRRVDEFFAPIFCSFWLDSDLQPVHDEEWLAKLRGEFQADNRAADCRDFDLNSARWNQISNEYDPESWRTWCLEASDKAEAHLNDRIHLEEQIEKGVATASRSLESQLHQRRSRLSYVNEQLKKTEQLSIQQEEALGTITEHAIRNPSIRLDAVGAIILSSQNPFSE